MPHTTQPPKRSYVPGSLADGDTVQSNAVAAGAVRLHATLNRPCPATLSPSSTSPFIPVGHAVAGGSGTVAVTCRSWPPPPTAASPTSGTGTGWPKSSSVPLAAT